MRVAKFFFIRKSNLLFFKRNILITPLAILRYSFFHKNQKLTITIQLHKNIQSMYNSIQTKLITYLPNELKHYVPVPVKNKTHYSILIYI